MAVPLSSLRVTSDYDSSAFVRGVQEQIAAGQRLSASSRETGTALATLDAVSQSVPRGVAALSRAYVEGYAPASRFEAELQKLARVVERDQSTIPLVATLYEGLARKYGLVADAASFAGARLESLRGVVASVNAEIASENATRAREEAAASATVAAAQREIAAREQKLATLDREAQAYQNLLNARLGIQTAPDDVARAERENRAQWLAAEVQSREAASENAQREIASLETLRTKYDALYRAEKERASALQEIDRLYGTGALGAIGSSEAMSAQKRMTDLANKHFADQERNLRQFSQSGRLAANEVVQLGYQMNDIVTGVLLGQSPFMIAAQQGGQVYQILAGSRAGLTGALRGIGTALVGLVTPATVAFTTIVAGALAAVAATYSYVTAQNEMARSIAGAGRASGSTIADVNQIGQAGSSTSGLSVKEAREFAAVLAATGRIGRDSLLPLVRMGHDLAFALGVDSKEAAAILARALESPTQGAQELERRFGSISPVIKQQIADLETTGRLYEAQQALVRAIAEGVRDVAEQQSSVAKGWTAFTNFISNQWDSLGEGVGRGLGLTVKSLDEQLAEKQAQLTQRTNDYGAALKRLSDGGMVYFDLGKQIRSAEQDVRGLAAEVTTLLGKMDAMAQRTRDMQDAQRMDATMKRFQTVVPEVGDRRQLENNRRAMEDFWSTAKTLREQYMKMGMSEQDATVRAAREAETARSRATRALETYLTPMERLVAIQQLERDAIAAKSPEQKAEIERRRALIESAGQNVAASDAESAARQRATTVLSRERFEMSEAARERVLAAQLATAAMGVELQAAGKSIAAAFELRSIEATRAQLVQDAARRRVAFDQNLFERLTQEIKLQAQLKQLEAERNLQLDLSFQRNTFGFTDSELRIAEQMRAIYKDTGWLSEMQNALAMQMRFNDSLKETGNAARDSFRTLAQDIASGKNPLEALTNSLQSFWNKLVGMAADRFWQQALAPLFGTSFFGSIFGGGTWGGALDGGGVELARGGVLAAGNITPFAKGTVLSGPTFFPMARGMGLAGEAGEEGVLPLKRGANGVLGVTVTGGGASTSTTIDASTSVTINGGADASVVASMAAFLEQRERRLRAEIPALVAKAQRAGIRG